MMQKKLPKGFHYFGGHSGIKKRKKDFGLIVAKEPCSAAAVFTKNTFCGECIPIGKAHVQNHELQAVVVTSGVANVATGKTGRENEYRILSLIAEKYQLAIENILPSSTGVIGPQLPIEKLETYIKTQPLTLETSYDNFAEAILTTDQHSKVQQVTVGSATVLGIVKGSGMIEPNMATMLAYIVTDAIIEKEETDTMLKEAVDQSFNTISIDTDTSTSDTVALLASGHYAVEKTDLQLAINHVCKELALDVVRDAEGATKTLFVTVTHAQTKQQAKDAGKSIINSPLVKTALFGCDPNWGRIVMAIGKTTDLVFDPERVAIYYGESPIFKNGQEQTQNLSTIETYLKEKSDIYLTVDLAQGNEKFQVIGCDLTYDYVEINSAYST